MHFWRLLDARPPAKNKTNDQFLEQKGRWWRAGGFYIEKTNKINKPQNPYFWHYGMEGQGGEPDLLARSLAWGFAWAPGPGPGLESGS